MTDSLRDRIAAAIARRMSADLMLGSPGADYAGAALTLADAVIRELKLQPHDHHYNIGYNRYITGWLK